MFTREDKVEINRILQQRGIKKGKGQIFDLIARGGTKTQVYEMIDMLTAEMEAAKKLQIVLRDEAAPLEVFGSSLITQNALDDMDAIMRLPFVMAGALMPDGHRVAEKRVPVGGVVVSDAIVPDIVGNDIACSVFLSITNMRVSSQWFEDNLPSLQYVLKNYAYFGLESHQGDIVTPYSFYQQPRDLETDYGKFVYDKVRAIARAQFGSSGDGNHFLEFGTVNVRPKGDHFTQSDETYLALLSHFGSRAVGSYVADAYTSRALEIWDMPDGMTDAPLDWNSPDGRDYWKLMQFAGDFAEMGHRW